LVVIYTFWLIFVLCRTCGDSRNLPFIHVRIRFFGVFTLIVTIIMISGIIFGAIGTRYNNSAEFLSFLSLFNLYCYTLAFVYLPARDAIPIPHSDKIGMVRLEEDDDDSFEYNLSKPENDQVEVKL